MTVSPPPVGPNLQQWARGVNAYLQRWMPRLQWKRGGDNPSENGVILWDETQGHPVVSSESEWLPLMYRDQMGTVNYSDATTSGSPISLIGGTWATLTNDGLGAQTYTEYLPIGVTSMLTGTGQLDVSQLSIGSFVMIRPDFTITPSTNNQDVEFRYSLGSGAGAYTLVKREGRMDSGSNIPYRYALDAHFIYIGNADTRDSPITLQVKTSGAGSVVNSGMALMVFAR